MATLNGRPAELSWLAGLVVPPGVELEVIDVGWRCDVIVTDGERQLTVIGDLATGDRLLSATSDELEALASLALLVLEKKQQWQADDGSGVEGRPAILRQLAAVMPGSRLLPSRAYRTEK